MDKIDCFNAEYRFLSNFYPCKITLDTFIFPSVEHYYQALKTTSNNWFLFCSGSAGQAKRLGQAFHLRPHWEDVKDTVMQYGLHEKFAIGSELATKLLATGTAELIEGNTWGDTYWGICNGVGQNKLGLLLMHRREILKGIQHG